MNAVSNISLHPIDVLLPRLDGVMQTGQGWRARCPAHGGQSRSLAIAEGAGGRLLLNCFAGCSVHEVLGAVGLTVGDLFVRRDLRTMTPVERSQLRQVALLPRWRAALEVLAHETNVVLIAANVVAGGEELAEADRTRLRVAALRIFDAQEALNAR